MCDALKPSESSSGRAAPEPGVEPCDDDMEETDAVEDELEARDTDIASYCRSERPSASIDTPTPTTKKV